MPIFPIITTIFEVLIWPKNNLHENIVISTFFTDLGKIRWPKNNFSINTLIYRAKQYNKLILNGGFK